MVLHVTFTKSSEESSSSPKNSPLLMGDTMVELSEEENKFFEMSTKHMVVLLDDTKDKKMAYTSVAKIFAHRAFEDEWGKFTEKLIKTVQAAINEKNCHAFKPYLRVAYELLGLEDSHQKARINKTMRTLLIIMEQNQ